MTDDPAVLCAIPRQSAEAAAWQSRFASLGSARTTKEGLRELADALPLIKRTLAHLKGRW
jgi:hypothetical protein